MAKDKKKPEMKQETPPFPSREAAMEALEKSTLSDAERARLYDPKIVVIDEKTLSPEERKRLADEIAALPPPSIRSGDVKVVHVPPLAPVSDAVSRLETEAKRGDPDAVLKSECMLEIEQRRLSASAIALLEDQRADLEAVQGVALSEAAIVFDTLRRAASPGETLVQAVERLEALARAVSAPAVGLIVQEAAPSLYKVHVVESDAEGVRVWDTEPGKAMPWHAAKVLVDRVVETKLTPEDKR